MNKYINNYNKYKRIFNLLKAELIKSNIRDINFIFGNNFTEIKKVGNRYILNFEPGQLLEFYKGNSFLDYKGRFKPRNYTIREFFILALYHELGHKILGHCEFKIPADNPIYKRLGREAIYLYPEVIQKQADIWALNKFRAGGLTD